MIQNYLSALVVFVYALAVTLGAFHGGMWAALGIALALALYSGVALQDRALPAPSKAWGMWLALWLGVTAVELPLSAYPDISRHAWFNLVSVFVPLWLLSSPRVWVAGHNTYWLKTSAVAAAIGALALSVELFSGGYLLHHLKKPDAFLTEYNRGMAHFVIVAFPILAGLWGAGRRRTAASLILLLLIPAGLTESHTAKLALMVGIGCTICAAFRPLWVQKGLAGFLILLIGFPFFIQKLFLLHTSAVERWHDSWRHRVEIWDYISYRIADRPWFGWGLGTTHRLDFSQPHGALYQIVTRAAPHAHNFICEIWVETGICGLLVAIGFMLYVLKQTIRLTPALQPFALGGYAAAVTVSLFGFDFWTDALWGAFALSAFAFAVLQQAIESRHDTRGA